MNNTRQILVWKCTTRNYFALPMCINIYLIKSTSSEKSISLYWSGFVKIVFVSLTRCLLVRESKLKTFLTMKIVQNSDIFVFYNLSVYHKRMYCHLYYSIYSYIRKAQINFKIMAVSLIDHINFIITTFVYICYFKIIVMFQGELSTNIF